MQYLIDGSNVAHWADDNPGNLAPLFTLVSVLHSKGIAFRVYFDANILHVVREAGGPTDWIAACLSNRPDLFVCVPANSQADDFLLQDSSSCGARIVTNDRYRGYENRFAWLSSERSLPVDERRLVGGLVRHGPAIGTVLQIPGMRNPEMVDGLLTPLLSSAGVEELIQGMCSNSSSPAPVPRAYPSPECHPVRDRKEWSLSRFSARGPDAVVFVLSLLAMLIGTVGAYGVLLGCFDLGPATRHVSSAGCAEVVYDTALPWNLAIAAWLGTMWWKWPRLFSWPPETRTVVGVLRCLPPFSKCSGPFSVPQTLALVLLVPLWGIVYVQLFALALIVPLIGMYVISGW